MCCSCRTPCAVRGACNAPEPACGRRGSGSRQRAATECALWAPTLGMVPKRALRGSHVQPQPPCRCPPFQVHKMLQGLIDQHSLAGQEQALVMAEHMASYFCGRCGCEMVYQF